MDTIITVIYTQIDTHTHMHHNTAVGETHPLPVILVSFGAISVATIN